MNMTATLIGILIFAGVLLFAVFSTQEVIKTKKEMKELKEELKKEEKKTEAAVEVVSETKKIKDEETKKIQEIENAETNEEVADIVNDIIGKHNDRVRKQTESRKSGSVSKTSKGNKRSSKSK